MNKKLLLSIFALLLFSSIHSQDVITKKTGEDIQSKVIEIGQDEVKYKKFDFQEGPTYTLLKSEIFLIRYENGSKDIFNTSEEDKNNIIVDNSGDNLFRKGEADASLYYKGHRGAGTGVLLTSLLSPIVGLIPAIATSASKPRYKSLGFPNEKLMENPDYFMGYTKKAKKIKQGKVWLNWGVAFGVNILAVAILTTVSE